MMHIDKKIINKHLEIYTKEIQSKKIEKLVEKEIRLNKTKSNIMLKNKILTNILQKGFYKEDINTILNEFEESLYKGFTKKEIKQLEDSLEKMMKNIEKQNGKELLLRGDSWHHQSYS